ncbi:glycosyltransferase family 2 protein [Mucilaginibacter conchicola]|uniref:Glycosyltransferase family 2 protein n=2 Tax=Mucilaginibacter conchicola TaxID=2303333 RepID=A0A372P002_9SPHI|nr:glycosyltransferase family 2 protein [Mucilaginibacter conchicola]
MNYPLVSIIIPVYNAEKHLAQCIESAMAQTWPNKELIIVNDGSTDDSFKIATSYSCSWIKVFDRPNKGASAARNEGMRNAQGEYIQFLDADDLISADKIEKQVTALLGDSNKLAVCSTVHFFDDDDPALSSASAYEDRFLIDAPPEHFLINLWGGYSDSGSMVQPNAWLIPRGIANKAGWWDEQLSLDDDGEYFCRVVLASEGIKKTEGYNYYRKYRNQNSLSAFKSHKGMNSLLLSVISKKSNLLKRSQAKEARFAIYKLLMDIMVSSYRRYPDIYARALKELPAHSPSGYKPSIGGPLASLVARIAGWKTARTLQLALKGLKNVKFKR